MCDEKVTALVVIIINNESGMCEADFDEVDAQCAVFASIIGRQRNKGDIG